MTDHWTLHSVRFFVPVASEHDSLEEALATAAGEVEWEQAAPDHIVGPDGFELRGDAFQAALDEAWERLYPSRPSTQ